ncbi:hypothetical protein [Castellaniella defragrans]|uniref:hypothetical protein n=1 Tax=Castellaniella defragrans TaxID=75697 RepID=UPI002AFDDFC9|nr:hypothetical protein [Castellaniella defragrans]
MPSAALGDEDRYPPGRNLALGEAVRAPAGAPTLALRGRRVLLHFNGGWTLKANFP